jgi:hypothetical protein
LRTDKRFQDDAVEAEPPPEEVAEGFAAIVPGAADPQRREVVEESVGMGREERVRGEPAAEGGDLLGSDGTEANEDLGLDPTPVPSVLGEVGVGPLLSRDELEEYGGVHEGGWVRGYKSVCPQHRYWCAYKLPFSERGKVILSKIGSEGISSSDNIL